MKPYRMFGLALFLIFIGFLTAQVAHDIEFRLGGTDTSSLLIFNGNGDILQSVTGNAVFNFGYKDKDTYKRVGVFNFGNTSGLTGFFNVAGNEYADGLGRDINLIAESIDGGSNAGNVKLSGGVLWGGGYLADPATLNLEGGKNISGGGVGGDVLLYAGSGEDKAGDVKISAGNPNSDGEGGSVIISSGRGSSGGDQGDITLACGGDTRAGVGPGNVYIYGGYADGGGGSIILKPGESGAPQPTYGLVQVIGSGTYTGSWSHTSDLRYKKNITPVYSTLKSVMKLNPVNFDWKKEEFPEKNFSASKQTGLIAQEVREYFPELVSEDENGYLSIDYVKLAVVLLRTIQEQQEIINKQNSAISTITEKFNEIISTKMATK
ncbi:MAG: tail fiber domain-containing protein [Ignavibacteria bacterium]|nr:tail fiber domain-containing protein [Ignavibacteria bacterium]